MANFADLTFPAGEDYVQPFTVKDAAGSAVVDVTGFAMTLTVRKYADASFPVLLTKTATVVLGPSGTCQVAFARADTKDLEPRAYAFDLSRTDAGADAALVIGSLFLQARSR